MRLGILITIIGGGSALLTYALIERRINQRACPHCGFRVSADAIEEHCPRCRSNMRADERERGRRAAPKSGRMSPAPAGTAKYPEAAATSSETSPGPTVPASDSARTPRQHELAHASVGRLLRIALIALPLLILGADGSIAIYRRAQPRTDKAIRLVKGSSSRIESFTVQQYIYATLFESKDKGVKISIDGWRAEQQPWDDRSVMVEFSFTNDGVPHRAVWAVDLSTDQVAPKNEDAWNLSWNSFQF